MLNAEIRNTLRKPFNSRVLIYLACSKTLHNLLYNAYVCTFVQTCVKMYAIH